MEQVTDRGIEKLMQRIGTGYTNYFNNKNKRPGSLFQGRFKAIHVDSNEYLLHLSAYVNLNDRVHQLGSPASKLVNSMSSWREYTDKINKTGGNAKRGICEKEIIFGQFRSKSEYKVFAVDSLKAIRERKDELRDIREMLLE
jgi:putative transposase